MSETNVINIKDAPEGWEDNSDYVYIGRGGHGHDGYFGNPYPLRSGRKRGSTLDKYKLYLQRKITTDKEFEDKLRGLKGKTLVCFCHPKPCHGHIMAHYIDNL